MLRAFVLAVMAMGAGCVMRPAELRERGMETSYVSSLAPSDAAACLLRRAQEGHSTAIAQIHPRDGAAGLEVFVYGMQTIMAIAIVEPAGAGSKVTVRSQPEFSKEDGYYRIYVQPITSGC